MKIKTLKIRFTHQQTSEAWQFSCLIPRKRQEARRQTRSALLQEKRTVAIISLVIGSKTVTRLSCFEWLLRCSEKQEGGEEKETTWKWELWAGCRRCLCDPNQKSQGYFPLLSSSKRPLKRQLWIVSHKTGNQEFEGFLQTLTHLHAQVWEGGGSNNSVLYIVMSLVWRNPQYLTT